jgi:hypothetical protein
MVGKIWGGVALLFVLALLGCQPVKYLPANDDFNLVFRYGAGKQNELNTFDNTFTKDMVNEPPVKVGMVLSATELTQIRTKMEAINFFSYPERLSSATGRAGNVVGGLMIPHQGFYFKVVANGRQKELWWADNTIPGQEGEMARKLRELTTLITAIIEAQEEYRSLPVPKGAYQ